MSGRPSLLAQAHRLVRDERLFGRGELVLCACSGGPDSSALLHVLALLRRRLGHQVLAAGIDHGLRPEAAAELRLAEALARSLDIELRVRQVTLAAGANLQARARQERLAALQDLARAEGATVIALGHTADDRAETLLMRLLRGAGPRGLGVLPARAAAAVRGSDGQGVDIVRPLLTARRSEVLAHLRRHSLGWADDPSNADRRFQRARVRHELVPLLEELSPRVVEHLCFLADTLGRRAGPDDPLEGLGRAQRQAVERAHRLGRPHVRLRLSGGRDVDVGVGGESATLGLDGPSNAETRRFSGPPQGAR
jgi:tRNA(Ile)-lysidine synthase